MNWKFVAILFITLFIVENLFFTWALYYTIQEEKKTYKCYYEVCEEYPEASYVGGICTCYEYDNLGYPIEVKTRWMQ